MEGVGARNGLRQRENKGLPVLHRQGEGPTHLIMPSIVINDLSKSYLLRAGFVDRVGQAMSTIQAGPVQRFGRRLTQSSKARRITALHPFSATIQAGESVAILGRNGSGKSTLLSLIADVLSPSGGRCTVNGRVSAILELGSGFHPDFSGRDNLRHKAALQGIAPRVLAEKMDDVLAFADIGEYIDEPISTYSTGMQMRLAFALNTVLEPEILIVDEALSVGDTFFQSRCIQWIEDFIQRGHIFLCVSHDIFTVRKLCQRGLVLEKGHLLCDAEIGKAVNIYYEVHAKVKSPKVEEAAKVPTEKQPEKSEGTEWHSVELRTDMRTGDGSIRIISVETAPPLGSAFSCGDFLSVRLRFQANHPVDQYHFGFGFRDKRGLLYGGFHTYYLKRTHDPLAAGDEVVATFELQLALPPGEHLLLVGIAENLSDSDWADFDVWWDAATLTILGPEKFWGLASLPHRNLEIVKHSAIEAKVP